MQKFDISWQEWVYLSYAKGMSLKLAADLLNLSVKTIVEVGVFKGYFSRSLRSWFPDAALHLVDPWDIYPEYTAEEAGPITYDQEEMEQAHRSVVEHFARDPLTKIYRMTSLKAAQLLPGEIDLVYIDGNHSYSHVKEDIGAWFRKVRKGGILAGDDYIPSGFPGVVRAVDEQGWKNLVVCPSSAWFTWK